MGTQELGWKKGDFIRCLDPKLLWKDILDSALKILETRNELKSAEVEDQPDPVQLLIRMKKSVLHSRCLAKKRGVVFMENINIVYFSLDYCFIHND